MAILFLPQADLENRFAITMSFRTLSGIYKAGFLPVQDGQESINIREIKDA
ncbi:MAG: hypothetical protein PHO32_06695 [Candidatus Cloacimonetes bacterium]|nr:hypothetical protein [Candidatus Cloacimonadota bacterium]